MKMIVQNILKERKYPFLFALFVLLISVTFFLISNSQSPISIETTNLSQSQSQTPSNPPPSSVSTPPVTQPRAAASNPPTPRPNNDGVSLGGSDANGSIDKVDIGWKLCRGAVAVDYIPCLDNWRAIKALNSRRHMEHRERHCPIPAPTCLIPLPMGYKIPVPWPKSKDMVWYDNVPHPKLVEYKKDQRWVVKDGEYFVFPGGGTQFKNGVNLYVEFIAKTLPDIEWGKHTRTVLDVGCGVASFGGYLLKKNVITMSFAPKDEHEAQIQFALERGIPSILSVIGTQKLSFPDNAYDVIHCARCRVHWDGYGGKPLLELNRVLRPGGFFIWSATPVYQKDEKHQNVWEAMVALTQAICWKMVKKVPSNKAGVGFVIYQKPVSSSCYDKRTTNIPPLCDEKNRTKGSWYAPLEDCLPPLPVAGTGGDYNWPAPWPERLKTKPATLSSEPEADQIFSEDTRRWYALVSDVYLGALPINWSRVRNVMDMNAGYGGFAAALINQPLWVMNVMPIHGPDKLSIIFDRGLIGAYHDWCESFNTYPRTYDLLHSSFLFSNLTQRCDIIGVAAEMDRILRPEGILLVQDTLEDITKLRPILESLHWSTSIHQGQFLVGKKGFWRPS